MKKSQNELILSHIKRSWLGSWECANKYGCLRLAARISDLRNLGHVIKYRTAYNGEKHWMEYKLA